MEERGERAQDFLMSASERVKMFALAITVESSGLCVHRLICQSRHIVDPVSSQRFFFAFSFFILEIHGGKVVSISAQIISRYPSVRFIQFKVTFKSVE